MPAERAGYTVTMFLVDISPSMGKMRQVSLPAKPGAEPEIIEMTNLEWALQYVMLKIQEMIFNGRKTDKCGVILFGSEETNNIINEENGGYEHVSEYIPIAQPNASTLAKLQALEPSTVSGDPIDALIVAIETQDRFLGNKKTWTRKICILTDGENPIEVEDWEATAKKMNGLGIQLSVIGVDFDDDDFKEEDKSVIKRENEDFYHTFTSKLDHGVVGNCDFALTEISRPDVREVKSTMSGNVLRIGDIDNRPGEAIEIMIRTAKCTALARPKSLKKFARRRHTAEEDAAAAEIMDVDDDDEKTTYAQLHMRSEYYLEEDKARSVKGEGSVAGSVNGDADGEEKRLVKVEKEELVRGYKYGASFVPAPEGGFAPLPARKGMDICGFFPMDNFRREYSMGEVYYVLADPASPMQQVALSSIVQAMLDEDHGVVAITRWTKTDKSDPKMGVLWPTRWDEIDCFLWVQMPFADDVRNFPFASLETLINKKGEIVKEHPYLPTKEQIAAMEDFVDAMDLMDAGEKDEDGNRQPWFDTRLSYNPAIHRTKQALFHAAVVQDLNTHPLPPPHPELTKYFEPPRRVMKRAREAIEQCKRTFNVREVPKKVARVRKDEHVHARDEDENMLLLDRQAHRAGTSQTQGATQSRIYAQSQKTSPSRTQQKRAGNHSDSSETEPEPDIEDEEELLLNRPAPGGSRRGPPLPTPARSLSPDARRDRDRAPGRIVGFTNPLQDFRKNIERGDVVTKAVEDLAFVIKDVVTKQPSSRRLDEMIECMHELRKVCLEEDEIDAWNDFIRDLKETCLETKLGNKDFWEKVRGIGRPLSFISQPEAAKAGGKSAIPESEAQKFIQD